MTPTFPGREWDRVSPSEAGFDADRLRAARDELDAADPEDDPRRLDVLDHENPYRVVIARGGRIVAEWNRGVDADETAPAGRMASATKSVFSSILAMAVDEGMVDSADAPLVDYFPEALDVLPGEGPKEGRHARHADRGITLRQLIANTSGYLKPGESPGEVKHYQTFGMNVLTHAVAGAYDMYDPRDPEGSPGFALLMDTRLRRPLRGSWDYYQSNFDHHEDARIEHFGYYPGINATARDMARLGWLWCNEGRWEGEQLIPADWMREAVEPVPADREADPERNMLETYGLGFWTNATGALWPSLPTDSFAAMGAGGIVVWACPSLDLVVVEGPGPFYRASMDEHLFPTVVDALESS
jgi:CubicO group peptidase (beta-lactamase class C family)